MAVREPSEGFAYCLVWNDEIAGAVRGSRREAFVVRGRKTEAIVAKSGYTDSVIG
jgi:hypothetical protein